MRRLNISVNVHTVSRRGLGYPVENAGRLVGVTSLISASALFVYLRFAKLLPRKKWIIVPGFAVPAFAAGWMTRMSPDVGEAALAVPVLLRGLLLLFIVPPVAKEMVNCWTMFFGRQPCVNSSIEKIRHVRFATGGTMNSNSRPRSSSGSRCIKVASQSP
ncbi:hypothetical protein OKW28_005009 [Paraburkholderia sp. 40]